MGGCHVCDSSGLRGGKGCHLNWGGLTGYDFHLLQGVEAGLRVIFVLSRWWQVQIVLSFSAG